MSLKPTWATYWDTVSKLKMQNLKLQNEITEHTAGRQLGAHSLASQGPRFNPQYQSEFKN